MDLQQEPQSSQPHGLYEWQMDHQPPRLAEDDALVNWNSKRDLSAIVQLGESQPAQSSSATHQPSRNAPSPASAPRRPGNANHPAHRPRHVISAAEPLDPEIEEALHQFTDRAVHMLRSSLKVSKGKAAKFNSAFKENALDPLGSKIRRRHTAEDVHDVPHAPPARSGLQSRSTNSRVSSEPAPDVCDEPMDHDQAVAGPSRRILRRATLTDFVNTAEDDSDDEDGGMPSSTPTPPPKPRGTRGSVPSTMSASSSSSKSKLRSYSVFSESPTELPGVPLSRRHSEDPSASCVNTRTMDAPELSQRSSSQQEPPHPDPPSPVIPSPVALAKQSTSAMPPPPVPAFSQRPPQVSQAPGPSRLPPNVSQSPALSRPYVMPSLSQGASASQSAGPPRASQRRPPALGMRPARVRGGGVSKYQIPREHPKAIAGFKVPFKTGAKREGGAAAGSNATAEAVQPRGEPFVVPDGAGTRVSTGRAPQLEMSARRAEPRDAEMDEDAPKEADSSYGDIPFDFDPQALDEAMSVYDP
ncbi:hypothetical protein C8Q77DRAFT_1072627 [Trametes polyzona]|nr:hypothetical protein C8Q77DRAFT_1072627 [Trametes polyzona]